MTPWLGLSLSSVLVLIEASSYRRLLTSISALMVLEKQPDHLRRGCCCTTCSITSLWTKCGWKPMLSGNSQSAAHLRPSTAVNLCG